MLKLLSAIFLFVCLTGGQVFALEEYFVIHLRGNVVNKTTNKVLKVGDKLSENDKIQFKSNDAVAVVISTRKGRFTLSGTSKPTTSTFDTYVTLVRNVLIPSKSRGMMSTRGGIRTPAISNLDSILDTNQFFFPGSVTKLRLSDNKYPMNKQKYFIWQFTYQGKNVKSSLPFSKDSLIIDRKKIYTVAGKYIEPESIGEAKLYYWENGSVRKIATFTPVFVEEKVLKEECEALVTALKNQKLEKAEILEELSKHVEEIYGRTEYNTFEKWVIENVKI